ncbi:histidine kinase [Paenibacillus sp. 2RAB27]|uniref:sensor histidine kinase n=1 Tax=Paenibacillus sp. 2RAB27 TaxID=3232991 RepID=UPI003F9B915F
MKLIEWFWQGTSLIRNMKLQNKLMVGYLLGCVIPMLVVSVGIYRQSVSDLQDSSQEFAALYTSQIESSLNNLMVEYDKITKSVLVDSEMINQIGKKQELSIDELVARKESIQHMLLRVALLKPEIGSLMLISHDNTVYQYTSSTNVVDEATLLTQTWYQRSRQLEETFFITGLHDRSYYRDKGDGGVVTVGRMLLRSDGAYAGMLLIDLDPSTLLELNQDFDSARDKYGITVIISNSLGQTVYHSDAASGRLTWNQVRETETNYTQDASNADRIVVSGSTQLGKLIVKTEIPRKKLLLKISKIKVVTVYVLLTGVLIMSVFSFGLSYTITRPIIALRRNMKQAELGHYLPIDKVQSKDEIGNLVHSYNKMIVTIRELIEDVYLAEIKRRKAKFLALQNQINPHMLYNTLESIRMKALVKEEEEIASMIKILAKMFRLALGKEGTRHLVKHELEYTVNYLQLQNIRFDNQFQLDIRMPEEMTTCHIIPLVFQPIVENSVNHGFQNYGRTLHIRIEGEWQEGDSMRIRISDDGIGVSPDKLEEIQALLAIAKSDKYKLEQEDESSKTGLGLKNIAERINLQYGDRYELSVHSDYGSGTTVEICIPIQNGQGKE